MTAPDLVKVIESAIDKHARIIQQSLHQACRCGWVGKVLAYDYPAHQARAVLAALEAVGTVEWGVQGKTFTNGDWDHVWTNDVHGAPLTETSAKNHQWLKSPVPFRVVSRLTFPWTAVK